VIVVAGGTGTLGTRLVRRLAGQGLAVRVLGIAVSGLTPYDAGYNWLSLAAGAVVGPALSIWLGTCLGRPETQAAT
jgi:nucleoside-diphosphate-sugar epimerase